MDAADAVALAASVYAPHRPGAAARPACSWSEAGRSVRVEAAIEGFSLPPTMATATLAFPPHLTPVHASVLRCTGGGAAPAPPARLLVVCREGAVLRYQRQDRAEP